MPVLNSPARFGILFMWSFAGIAIGAYSCCCFGDEKAAPSTQGETRVVVALDEEKPADKQPTSKVTTSNAATESYQVSQSGNALASNDEDPPLLDLTELLLLLGDLPALTEDSESRDASGVGKADPMAITRGTDSTNTCEIVPKTTSLGTGKSSPATALPGMVKLTSTSDETSADSASTLPIVINPLRASPSPKLNPASTPSVKTTTSSATTKPSLPNESDRPDTSSEKATTAPVAVSTEKPLEMPVSPKSTEQSLATQKPTAMQSTQTKPVDKQSADTKLIDEKPAEPVMTQAGEAKSVTDKPAEPLTIGSALPSTQLPSDPPTLVMEDNPSDKKSAAESPLKTAENESAVPADKLPNEISDNDASMKDSTEESATESVAETMKDLSPDSPSIVDELAELVVVPGTPSNETNTGSTKPKRKLVTVKVLTEQDQEAPNLQDAPREIDSKQARDEDENAAIAKRPQASKKSFVESPSDLSGNASKEKASTPPKSTPAKIETAFSPAEVRRKQRVESCLAYYIANPETVVERSPWAVMHAMLPFGVEGEVIVGNKRVNSIQWMCYNGTCRTQKMFTPSGRSFRPNVGGGVQGHEGQFLAMLAQSQVSADYPIVVANKRYTVLDLVRYEMATCKERTELTFKLIALSYYVDTNQAWTAMDRRKWNIEKLVAEELAQPVVGSACGGTHRLMGLTFALRQRKAEGRPIDGHFARADKFIADYIDYTWTLQNPDGSFSSNWFESRGHEQNKERLVQTTGHILEWLMFTLPKDKLDDPRVLKSVDFLLNNIWDDRTHKWPIGPRGHATRAIALYQQRVYGVQPGQRHTEMAAKIDALKLRR